LVGSCGRDMKRLFSRIKRFQKSGAYLYLPQKLVEDDRFPFKDDEVVKLVLDPRNKEMIVTIPEWWELLDWSKMRDAYEKLPVEIKQAIDKSGIMKEEVRVYGKLEPDTEDLSRIHERRKSR